MNAPLPTALVSMAADEIPADLLPMLEERIKPIWSPDGVISNPDESNDVELLITANATIDADYLSRLPALRAVITTGTAYDYVDLAYCRDHGVKVHNTPGYTGSSVAEHAFALLLTAVRHVVTYDTAARRDEPGEEPIAFELAGRTAGIIGLGDVGGRIARFAQAFDMRVVFTNRSAKHFEGAEQVDLHSLLKRSDAVFLTVPLTPETDGLIGAEELAVMKPSAFLVNVSSDELVDVPALRKALNAGLLGGAAFDVIGDTSPYRDLARTVLTPVKAWYTTETVRRRAATWIETVRDVAAGGDRNRVG